MLNFWTKTKRLMSKFKIEAGYAISVLHVYKGSYYKAEQHFINKNKEN